DLETAKEAQKALRRQGLEFRLGAKVTGVEVDGGVAAVQVEGADPVEADKVLVCVGRKPNTRGLGLEELGVELDERGRVKVDAGYATSVPGVHAIGDLIPGPMLAHKASEDGVALMELIAGVGSGSVDHSLVPGVVYTEPEVATVGATEEQLAERGVPYRTGVFPFSATGRARGRHRRPHGGAARRAGCAAPQGRVPVRRQRSRPRPGPHRRPREGPRSRRDRQGPGRPRDRAARR